MMKVTLTVKEVAELLRVSTGTIYAMVREEQIPYFRARGVILFHRETIEKWMTGELAQVAE